MVLSELNIIFSVILLLFIPGFLFSLLVLKHHDLIELMAFSVGFSIAIDSILALFLTVFQGFGGIVKSNILLGLALIIFTLLLFNVIKRTTALRSIKRV